MAETNPNTHVIEHPLIQHKLTLLRKKETGPKEFRELLDEISMLMAYEVTRDAVLEPVEVETPMGTASGGLVSKRKFGIVPVLRAGLGMMDGILRLMPTAKVGHIGLYRDEESLKPVEYYCKLPPDAAERSLIVVDPMLATGGSASAAIQFVKDRGAADVRLMGLIATPVGLERIYREHPDVEIYTAAIDPVLDERGFIFPGLGDAGDRLFGT